MYIWQDAGWPHFVWQDGTLMQPLAGARLAQGKLLGQMESLGSEQCREAEATALVGDAVQTSAIEGVRIDPEAVRSSVARRMQGGTPGKRRGSPETDGLAALGLETLQNYEMPLTVARLQHWHTLLAPSFEATVPVGQWRDDAGGPMQVVSGRIDAPRVHFEAPPAPDVASCVEALVTWFNRRPAIDGLIRSAVAHFWLVTIHPFDDGNGRVARALGDLALSQDEGTGRRLYSLAAQINTERSTYYEALQNAQRGDMDITPWLVWYLGCYGRAIDGARALAASALSKGQFWQRHAGRTFNERQRKVLHRLLDGFEGNLTAKKWAALCKVSVDTAQRDIVALVAQNILRRNPGGSKRTSYRLDI